MKLCLNEELNPYKTNLMFNIPSVITSILPIIVIYYTDMSWNMVSHDDLVLQGSECYQTGGAQQVIRGLWHDLLVECWFCAHAYFKHGIL